MSRGIAEKLSEFLQNPSRGFVEKNLDLLSPSTDLFLHGIAKQLRSQGTEEDVARIEDCRRLLYVCKKIGVKKGFAFHKSRLTMDPHLRQLLQDAREKATRATEQRLPDLAKEAWKLCQDLLTHPKFLDTPRDFQFIAFTIAVGAGLHNWLVNRDQESISAALSMGLSALELGDPKSDQYSLLLTNLALACELPGSVPETSLPRMASAVQFYERAISLYPQLSPGARANKCNLARVCRKYTEMGGPLTFLDRGVTILTEVLEEAPLDSEERDTAIILLSNALQSRYEKTSSFATLDEAIRLVESRVQTIVRPESRHAGMYNNLGTALLERWERLHRSADLETARRNLEIALELTPLGSAERTSRLLNSGNCLYKLAEQNSDPGLARLAQERHEEGLRLAVPGGREEMGLLLAVMGRTFKEFEASGDQAVAFKAIELVERILKSESAQPHDLSIAHIRKGHLYYQIFDKTADVQHVRIALAAFGEGMKFEEAAPLIAYTARQSYIEVAATIGDWPEAVKAGQELRHLHEKMVQIQPSAVDKLALLRQFRGSHLFHAFSLAKMGYHEQAVEILEAGQIRYLREVWAKKSIEAKGEFLADLGFDGLNLSPKVSNIKDAAVGAPLVYLFSTPMGGMALIVDSKTIRQVLLPEFSKAGIVNGAIKLPKNLPGFLVAYSIKSKTAVMSNRWRRLLVPYLDWIWRAAIRPLLEAFGSSMPPEIVLIPCGFASLLPFHAALSSDGVDFAIDRVRIRYAPSCTFAIGSRRPAAARTISVAAVRAPDLPGSEVEAACIQEIFGSNCSKLIGETLEVAEVLKLIEISEIFHFSGHARALEDPFLSSLDLGGKDPLTLKGLLERHFPNLRLAVLSGCETAMVGMDIAEEGLGLPGGFLQAGSAGVIASTWLVNDGSAPFLMSRLYWLIERHGQEPAQALREAQIWLRDASRSQLLDWAQSEEDFTLPLRKMSLPNQEHPFSDPYHWAAFAYFGS